MEIFICELPGLEPLFKVDKILPTNVDPDAGEVVEHDEDLANDADGVLNVTPLALTFISLNPVTDLHHREVQSIDLIDADDFKWGKEDVHPTEAVR